MNYSLLCRYLGIVCLLIGASMAFSLPFAFPTLAVRTYLPGPETLEMSGVLGLLYSMAIAMILGGLLVFLGRSKRRGQLFLKEAMAVVGLSWVLATVLECFRTSWRGLRPATINDR